MSTSERTSITVQTLVNAPVSIVWMRWTNPQDIIQWNAASDDWHTTQAENNLHIGGGFSSRMEAKDGSMGFDFYGVYSNVVLHRKIEYTLGDDRRVTILFNEKENQTEVIETFEAENTNSVELQRGGWQAILDKFKKYVESKKH